MRNFLALAFISTLIFLACKSPSGQSSGSQNSAESLQKPYVILVSIDGFRYDYAGKYGARNILKFASEGVQAVSMRPVFPSSTFPNHYTIATGMYPAHHNLVANTFYNREKDEMYMIRDRDKVEDGDWYGGRPLWVLAEKDSMVAASYFWVGSEADVRGIRPSYYYQYDSSVPNQERVDQVIQWLQLPEAERPHFITLYFSVVDSKGHSTGPESEETRDAVLHVDKMIGDLDQKVAALDLPVNIILVSDHGMYPVNLEKPVYPEMEVDLDGFVKAKAATYWMLYHHDPGQVDEAFRKLEAKANSRFQVYRQADIPAYLHYGGNPLIGDILIMANPPNILTSWGFRDNPGQHGYDPYTTPEMGAIFYAKGPSFRKGMTIPTFQNIHVYPLITHILGLENPGDIDGDFAVLDTVLVSF